MKTTLRRHPSSVPPPAYDMSMSDGGLLFIHIISGSFLSPLPERARTAQPGRRLGVRERRHVHQERRQGGVADRDGDLRPALGPRHQEGRHGDQPVQPKPDI
ncbi:hypothetical protein PG984_005728 [Apiospora sp. TS-2023a]